MKVLKFKFRDQYYMVNERGQIKTNNSKTFSENWFFLGGSSHHWCRYITVTTKQAFENPKLLEGCLGWDCDHGTTRQWGGRFNGKLPRISDVKVFEI